MSTQQNANNNTDDFFWDSEMLIGYINSKPNRKYSVSIATKNSNSFVVFTDSYKKKSSPWKVKKNFVVPLCVAPQLLALINSAIKEGKNLGILRYTTEDFMIDDTPKQKQNKHNTVVKENDFKDVPQESQMFKISQGGLILLGFFLLLFIIVIFKSIIF